MATATLSPSDLRIRDAVVRELDWDPDVDASGIGVSASHGAVVLSGFIDSYAGKLSAERAAKRVRGVRAVGNDLQVRLRIARPDERIAQDVAQALATHTMVPPTVQATVHQGHVTLTGRVPWLFHRTTAEVAVRHIAGVVDVVNRIEVVPTATPADVQERITAALRRAADLNASQITAKVDGTRCTLTGTVTSWAQRRAAERAAEQAPGITDVENRIEVAPGEL